MCNNWMPFLLIENSQKQRETGAAVESFRNETLSRISQTDKVIKVDDSMNELKGDQLLIMFIQSINAPEMS